MLFSFDRQLAGPQLYTVGPRQFLGLQHTDKVALCMRHKSHHSVEPIKNPCVRPVVDNFGIVNICLYCLVWLTLDMRWQRLHNIMHSALPLIIILEEIATFRCNFGGGQLAGQQMQVP
jgi:hypothetical protein